MADLRRRLVMALAVVCKSPPEILIERNAISNIEYQTYLPIFLPPAAAPSNAAAAPSPTPSP